MAQPTNGNALQDINNAEFTDGFLTYYGKKREPYFFNFKNLETLMFSGTVVSALTARILNLETNEKEVTYFEVVTGASSGNQVNVPTTATIVLDKFGSSGDAVLSTVDGNNNPTWESPRDSTGAFVTASMAANGTYTFSSTPLDANVAVVYIFWK